MASLALITIGSNFVGSAFNIKIVHKEIKRRTKKVGAFTNDGGFTNDASLLRLATSILIDINEEWITGNRYLSVKSAMISLDTGCADFTAI